ncbi:MAG: hypothetical protein ACYTGH_22305, partial [Planctomycetota bacterium]
YGEQVLAACPCRWPVESVHRLRLTCRGKRIIAAVDGKIVLEGVDEHLGSGGAGFLVETGRLRIDGAEVS